MQLQHKWYKATVMMLSTILLSVGGNADGLSCRLPEFPFVRWRVHSQSCPCSSASVHRWAAYKTPRHSVPSSGRRSRVSNTCDVFVFIGDYAMDSRGWAGLGVVLTHGAPPIRRRSLHRHSDATEGSPHSLTPCVRLTIRGSSDGEWSMQSVRTKHWRRSALGD